MRPLRHILSSRKRLALALALVAALTAGVAYAYLAGTVAAGSNGGASSGSLPKGNTPSSVSVSGTSVTVSFSQSSVGGQFLGQYTGGGYTIKRYPAGGGSAVTPGAGCNTTIGGSASMLSCTESNVPGGSWKYTVTPVLNSWLGTESDQSAAVSIASIGLSPTSGHVGDTITISGANFPANSTIAATYGGSALTLSPASPSTDASGNVPSGVTFTVPASIAGAHTVQVTAGARSASATFTVSPSIALNPASGGAGTGDSISGSGFAANSTVTATFGGSSVTLGGTTKTDGSGSFSGATYTVPGDAAGSYNVVVSDGSSHTATASYQVTFGPLSKLVYTTQPSGASGGTAFTTQPVVTAEDAAGNIVTTYAGTVTLSIKSGTGTTGATLSGCSGSLSNGVITFSGCKIDKAGSGYVLTASDGTLSVDSTPFAVAVGSATKLALSASLTTLTAGGSSNLTITAVDAGGNTATGYTGSHELTFSGANAIGANNPTVTNSSGEAKTFGAKTAITFASGVAAVKEVTKNGMMKLYKAETAKVVVSDGTINNGSGLSVTVKAAAATLVAFVNCSLPTSANTTCSGQPIEVANQTSMTFNMQTQDSFGNPSAPTGTLSITFTNSETAQWSIAGSPATITPPESTSTQITLKQGKNGLEDTVTAKATGFPNAILTAKK